MKLSVRLKAAWRAFKNPYATGALGFGLLGSQRFGFIGTPIHGGMVDPVKVMESKAKVSGSRAARKKGYRIVREVMESGEESSLNPAVREAYRRRRSGKT